MAIVFKEYTKDEMRKIGDGEKTACDKCAFRTVRYCQVYKCTPEEREDKKSGYYVSTDKNQTL